MAGFLFCVGDMGDMMNAKGTVTREILDMCDENPKIAYINADGTGKGNALADYSEKYPHRVFDVGIQEMNMITCAAGMAKMGYIPYVQTFGPFLLFHAYDQVHNDICYNDFPVKLIGTHAGTSSGLGPTHNDIVDFAICNALPNMTVLAPCDAGGLVKATRKAAEYPHPVYIRVPRGEEPMVYPADFDYEFEIGKAIEIKEGKDVVIIAAGSLVYHAVKAAEELQEKGIDAGVIDMHTIKPIDKNAILKAAKCGNIITAEDHNIVGGLGSITADVLIEAGVSCRLKKIGIPDRFIPFGYPEQIYHELGMDKDGLVKAAMEMIAG